jgi:hypothetical protein
VLAQVTDRKKSLFTHDARMILLSMREHVPVPRAPKIVRLVANAARKPPFVVVLCKVIFEVAQGNELTPTILASELLDTQMRESVPSQITWPAKRPAADFASQRLCCIVFTCERLCNFVYVVILPLGMNPHVLVSTLLMDESIITNATLVDLFSRVLILIMLIKTA